MSEQEVSRPKYSLPTERIAFDRQLEILRAYVSASGSQANRPVSNNDLGGIVKLNASTASLPNAFFRDARLLEQVDGGHLPTPYTIEYARAFEWDQETAGEKLQPAFRESWFDQAIRPTLSIRPMSEDEALTKLADASSVGPKHRPQLKILLQYLEASGLIRREGSQVLSAAQRENPQAQPKASTSAQAPIERSPVAGRSDAGGGVNLDIHIRASMEQIKDWPPERITAFFGGIAAVLAAKGGGEPARED